MIDKSLAINGHFKLKVFRRGKLVEEVDEQNVITVGLATIIPGLVIGASGAQPISMIGFGNSNVPATPGVSYIGGGSGHGYVVEGYGSPPGSFASVAAYYKPFDSVSQTVGVDGSGNYFGIATFNFSMASGEANGMSIWEYGLTAAYGSGPYTFGIIARKVRSSVLTKTSAWSFSGSWTLQFPVVAADEGGVSTLTTI